MSTSIDPKRVLKLINSMGYKNVSANELKDFTKDLRKLVKYEQKSKSTSTKVPTVKTAPENVINVTIIQESCKKIPTENQPTKKSKAQGLVVQLPPETESKKSDASDDGKSSKNLIRLSKHIKTKNPKIVYKKGVACGVKGGMLVRNTPTDLYKKYQDDWHKFKSYIPGENSRTNLRRSVRRKMQHKDDDDGKVYVHFPDEPEDH